MCKTFSPDKHRSKVVEHSRLLHFTRSSLPLPVKPGKEEVQYRTKDFSIDVCELITCYVLVKQLINDRTQHPKTKFFKEHMYMVN